MGAKRKKVYETLVDGATEGYCGNELLDFMRQRYAKISGKKIVRAALLALTDPHMKDRNVLNVIYAFAIEHRMNEVFSGDDDVCANKERAQEPPNIPNED